jgi:hypothetical protein
MIAFRLALTGVLLAAAACSAPSQPYLDNAKLLCQRGDQVSCGQVPGYQAQVNAEQNEAAGKVAIGILLGLTAVAAGAAAGYSASQPSYVYAPVIVCRSRWGC